MLRSLLIAALVSLGGCADTVAPSFQPVTGLLATPEPAPMRLSAMPSTRMPLPFVDASADLCDARADDAFRRPVPKGNLDRALFDRAVLHYTNIARCRAGLSPLRADARLSAVATGHSADMVQFKFFGHASPLPGKTTVSDRLRNRGVPFAGAAENLATAKRLNLGNGTVVYPLGYDRCAYSRTPGGPVVRVRTYGSLAQHVVDRWIASPGHRRNLMNPTYTRHGASGVIDPTTQLCETISATQLFAG